MRKNSYSTGEAAATNITLYPEDKPVYERARELAADLDITFSELVWTAVDDYVTLHQHCAVHTTYALVKAQDYSRTLRTNGAA